MRIGAISDIHVDINSQYFIKFIDKLISFIDSKNLDILIIPGDIAGDEKYLIKFFVESKKLDIPYKMFIPGNHDMWTDSSSTSWELYLTTLPEICNEYSWHYLSRNPIRIDNTIFIGSPGWYDYSTRNINFDHDLSNDDYQAKQYIDVTWMDKHYIRFGMDDRQVSNMFIEQLIKDYQRIKYIDSESLVLATHIVPYQDMVHHSNKLSWDYFSAFIGCVAIGDFLDKLPEKNKHAIFGHSHFPQIRMRDSGVMMHCVPLGYKNEMNGLALSDAFERSMSVFEI